jgi:hypothetical protein
MSEVVLAGRVVPIRRALAKELARELGRAEEAGELTELFHSIAERYKLHVRNGRISLRPKEALGVD